MTNHPQTARGIIIFLLCMAMSACAGSVTILPPAGMAKITEKVSAETGTPTNTLAMLKPSSTYPFIIHPTRNPLSTPRPSTTSILVQPATTDFIPPQIASTLRVDQPRTALIASFPGACDNPFLPSLSPSGNWLVLTCGDNWGLALQIINRAGIQWRLLYKNYLPPDMNRNGPAGQLTPVHWTGDEQYLYISSHIGFDGGAICLYQQGDSGLYRLDLKTGFLSATLPYREPQRGYELAFSPDGSKLAYYADRPTIFDLQTGVETAFYTGDRMVGDLIWSPDSKELAYSTCQTTQGGVGKSSIQIYSLEKQVQKAIYEVDGSMLRVQVQNGKTQIKISDDNYRTNEIKYLFFDWSSEQLITATLTPAQ